MLDENNFEKSSARRQIMDRIKNIDVSDFDVTPWTDENIIRPLPGAQEQFLLSKAQITLYGGKPNVPPFAVMRQNKCC